MTLYPEEAAKIIQKIDELKPHIKDMRGRSSQFIQDQVERIDKYGPSTSWSPAQIKWINDLHDEFVGSDDPTERDDDEDEPDMEFSPR